MLFADPPERPIVRGIAGPGLLAKTVVYRWQDHLPVYRQESIHARDGLELARSTICGWHQQLADLVERVVEAMLRDAFTQPYLCVDATGILVQAKEQCRKAHFWVMVAPERHVIYRYSHKHDSAAVDQLLAGYKGHLVADAHSVYDHLHMAGGYSPGSPSRILTNGDSEISQVPGEPSRTRALVSDPGGTSAPGRLRRSGVAFRVFHRVGSRDNNPFEAQSHGPHARCLRFAAGVAS